MALAIVIILLVIGSIIFHFASPWYLTPLASNWGMIDSTIDITFAVTGIVFVAVNLFTAYAVIKYRHKKGQKADYEPENKKLETWLTVITAVGVAAMLAPGLVVWGEFVDVPEDAMEVEVVGQQWHWSYRFPGQDGVLGTVDNALISPDNPFGMKADDPAGSDDILVNDATVHLPLDQPVKLLLRSKDVLHNFTVTQFRVKMDLVPGMVTHLWFTPTKTGHYEVLCEELCGVAHHAMRGNVYVDEQEDFEAWLGGQQTYAQIESAPAGDIVMGQAQYAVCAACHGFQAEGNQLLNAPKLTGQEDWYLKRQIKNYKAGLRGTHEDDLFGRQMQPMVATLIDDQAISNVVAYIQSLPDDPAPTTVVGDISKGERLYTTCASCHGSQAQGIWSIKAPRAAGMSDWYLVAQLQNFRDGLRGAHRDDRYGAQMSFAARALITDDAINDVVAYINTL
jgi:cytochrome c oxidase subunit 2